MLSVVSLKQRSVRLLFGANLMHIHFTGEYKTKIIYLGGILFPLLSQLCASIFPIIFLFASFIRKTELICSGAKSWKHTNNLLKQIENNMHWRKKAKKEKNQCRSVYHTLWCDSWLFACISSLCDFESSPMKDERPRKICNGNGERDMVWMGASAQFTSNSLAKQDSARHLQMAKWQINTWL